MHSSYQLDGIGTIKSSSHLHISRTQELDKEYPSSQKCVGSYELYLTGAITLSVRSVYCKGMVKRETYWLVKRMV